MIKLPRRDFLKATGAAGAAGLLSTFPNGAFAQNKPDRITVTSYGGVWETAIRDYFVADFKKRTGVDADVQLGNPNQWISQVKASPNKPPLDAVVATAELIIEAGRAGLVDKIDGAKLSNLKDVDKRFVDICEGWGVCFDYGAGGFGFHKGRVKNPPKSFVEFVDRTAKGEWTASMMTPNWNPATLFVIWALNDVYGGKLDDITPALDAIKRMKKNCIFWGSVTDFLTHLSSGEADIGIYPDGRVWAYYDTGAHWIDFINPSEGGVMIPVAIMKPKNAPDIAWEYINSMIAVEPQAKFAEKMNYGVTNNKVVYSDKVKPRITPWEKTRFPPIAEIGPHLSNWIERWNKEIGV